MAGGTTFEINDSVLMIEAALLEVLRKGHDHHSPHFSSNSCIMNTSCASTHPHQPPQPILSATSNAPICLHCILHILTSPHTLPTIRRASISQLPPIDLIPSQSQSHVLDALLKTVVALPPTQHSFAHDTSSYIMNTQDRGMKAQIMNSCIRVLCHGESGYFCVPLLAMGLSEALIHPDVWSGKFPIQSDEIHIILQKTLQHTHVPSIKTIVEKTIDHLPNDPNSHHALFQHALNTLPPRRDVDRDDAFLTVVRAIANTCLVPSDAFADIRITNILCSAFVSRRETLVRNAREIIQSLCELCRHEKVDSEQEDQKTIVEFLLEQNIFEYIIEALRTHVSSAETIDKHSAGAAGAPEDHSVATQSITPAESRRSAEDCLQILHSLIIANDKLLSQRWRYTLDVLVQVADEVNSEITFRVLHHALSRVENPVLGAYITPVVAIVMTACTKHVQNSASKDRSCLKVAVDCLLALLERWRMKEVQLHAVIGVCEMPVAPYVAQVMKSVLDQFFRLANGSPCDAGQSATCVLGQRILHSVFEIWGSVNAGDTNTELRHVQMEIFGSSLHEVFITLGCWSDEQRDTMRAWCWKRLPPCAVWSAPTVKSYLRNICMPSDMREDLVPVTESDFLSAICWDGEDGLADTALHILESAVKYRSIDSLCRPDMIVSALVGRLQSWKKDVEDATPRIVRAVSYICMAHGLCFPFLELNDTCLKRILEHDQFRLNNEADVAILRHIIERQHRGRLDVVAWELFANQSARSLGNKKHVLEIFELVTQNQFPCQSVIYAMSHSTKPDQIVDSLLDCCDLHRNSERLVRAFEKAGIVHYACTMLQRLETSSNEPSPSLEMSDVSLDFRRTSSFLLVLSSTGCIADSAASWDLARCLCEAFTRYSVVVSKKPATIRLLSSIVRCVVAILLSVSEDRTIEFIKQSGFGLHAARILRDVRGTSTDHQNLLSGICCAILLLLNRSKEAGCSEEHLHPTAAVLKSINDYSMWETLFLARTAPLEVDEANRITNACHLFKAVLDREKQKGRRCSLQIAMVPDKIIILLCLATCTTIPTLCDAAFAVLQFLLENVKYPLAIVREVTKAAVVNMSLPDTGASHASLLFLHNGISKGYLDERLGNWRKKVLILCDQTLLNSRTTTLRERRRTGVEDLRAILLARLYLSLEERFASYQKSFTGRSGLTADESPSPTIKGLNAIAAQPVNFSSRILFGRYSMTWTIEASEPLA